MQSSKPIVRGRKLVLQYTDGSPCHASTKHHTRAEDYQDAMIEARANRPRKLREQKDHNDDEDDEGDEKDKHGKSKDAGSTRRKSALISLLCDRDPLAPKASVAFVGASPDDCSYFFELRSQYACGGVSVAQQTLGPAGVFGVMLVWLYSIANGIDFANLRIRALIAILVYLVGGCVYQRTVMHARGWRQLPNYSMWAGIGSFIKVSIVDSHIFLR